MKGNDSNGSYVGDNNNSFEEEMPSQPQAFHDFVFGKEMRRDFGKSLTR